MAKPFSFLDYKGLCFCSTFIIPTKEVHKSIKRIPFKEELHGSLVSLLEHFITPTHFTEKLHYCGTRMNLFNCGKDMVAYSWKKTGLVYFDANVIRAITFVKCGDIKTSVPISDIWCTPTGLVNDEFAYDCFGCKGFIFPFKLVRKQ